MSRRKTDDELKQSGTWRPDRHDRHEATAPLLKSLPPPPIALTPQALTVYNQEGANLIEQKTLKASDVRLLASYAVEMGVYANEMAFASEEGATVIFPNGIRGVNPHRKAAMEALKLASALGEKLGLSPASRAKLKGNAAFKEEQPEKPDPIAALLSNIKRN